MARRSPRSLVALERRVATAASDAERAQAEFDLAVFHDNNSREKAAIPHYEAALRLGLSGELRARCLAWLASSLCKTRRFDTAGARLQEARAATSDDELLSFLQRLERRLERDSLTADMEKVGRLLRQQARVNASNLGRRSGPL